MSGETRPLFVARRTYHRRRMADAAKLLPILGGGLFVVPLLWRSDTGEGPGTVEVMLYLFLVWIALAVAAGLVSRRLPEPGEEMRRDNDG